MQKIKVGMLLFWRNATVVASDYFSLNLRIWEIWLHREWSMLVEKFGHEARQMPKQKFVLSFEGSYGPLLIKIAIWLVFGNLCLRDEDGEFR